MGQTPDELKQYETKVSSYMTNVLQPRLADVFENAKRLNLNPEYFYTGHPVHVGQVSLIPVAGVQYTNPNDVGKTPPRRTASIFFARIEGDGGYRDVGVYATTGTTPTLNGGFKLYQNVGLLDNGRSALEKILLEADEFIRTEAADG